MTNFNLFEKENISLLCPYSFEYINHLIGLLGYSQEEYDSLKVREHVFFTLRNLFELKVLLVYDWAGNKKLNNEQLSIEDTLKYIDRLWFKGAKYPDFYSMVLFGATDWYEEALRKLGLSATTNWEWFVENKIGNLEKWIEENKPKE